MNQNPPVRSFPSKNFQLTKISKAMTQVLADGQMKLKANAPLIEGDLIGTSGGNIFPVRGTILPTNGTVGTTITMAASSTAATLGANNINVQVGSCAMPDGGFCLASNNASGYPQFAIYDYQGNLKVSPIVIQSVANSNGYGSVKCTLLTNGNIVFTFHNASSYPQFAIYSPTGTQVVAPTTIQSIINGTSSGIFVTTVAALQNGNFVVAFNNASWYPQFAIYSPTGTQVVAPTTLLASANGQTTSSYVNCAVLQNGNIIFVYNDNISYPRFSIFTQAGVSVVSSTVINSAANGSAVSPNGYPTPAVCVLQNGNFVVLFSNATTNVLASIYTQSGVQIGISITIYGSSPSGYLNLFLTPLSNGGFVAHTQITSSTYGQMGIFNSAGGNVVAFISNGVASNNNISIQLINGDLLWIYGTAFNFTKYNAQSVAILGVALQPASIGNYFTCQTCGALGKPQGFELRQGSWLPAQVFDHRSAGGIYGVIQNKTAILKGFI